MSRSTVSAVNVPAASHRGSWLVAGLLALGVAAALVGVWFQREQTRQCLGFYGPAAARRITSAADVELLVVRPGRGPRSLKVVSRRDVSRAAGLVHLRRGLVEDANFTWPAGVTDRADAGRRPPPAAPRTLEAWDTALVFRDQADGGETTLVIDFDAPTGALTVVGQPGRIGLGRIGPGLEKWIRGQLHP
jgi:hypothetical protein